MIHWYYDYRVKLNLLSFSKVHVSVEISDKKRESAKHKKNTNPEAVNDSCDDTLDTLEGMESVLSKHEDDQKKELEKKRKKMLKKKSVEVEAR